ncbi:hypothetical protein HDU98_011176 [Podochytrium sp. JEL0797]|nr:hypothetical protein HDU98_011176 [Podochytrium sp. JEL0797]
MLHPLLILLYASKTVLGQSVIASLHLNPSDGPVKLEALARNAASLPLTRLVLSFVRPDMVYVPGSNTLQYSDIGYSTTGDFGFAAVQNAVQRLRMGGVEVFLSMGGLNNNCYPYFSMEYSIAGVPSTPQSWKIQQYGGGSIKGCSESNMFCHACDMGLYKYSDLKDLSVFPEPNATASWQMAQGTVERLSTGAPVKWNPLIIGGSQYVDPVDNVTISRVPGNDYWVSQGRDPYVDFVYLARDLGLDGVDVDYNEVWHADTFRTGSGPFAIDQTVYKYAAILIDVSNAIQAHYPKCKLSVAASPFGAVRRDWWGGSLQGLWHYTNVWFPGVFTFITRSSNAGGINVKTFDLSSNNADYQCSSTIAYDCNLAAQIEFFIGTFESANLFVRIGFEVGQPSFPDPFHDPHHQLPLTTAVLQKTLSGDATVVLMGCHFWELYKAKNDLPTGSMMQKGNLGVNEALREICRAVLPRSERCSGTVPDFSVPPVTPLITGEVHRSPSHMMNSWTMTAANQSGISNHTVVQATTTTAFTAGNSTQSFVQPPPGVTAPSPSPTISINAGDACPAFGDILCEEGVSYQCLIGNDGSFIWERWFVNSC